MAGRAREKLRYQATPTGVPVTSAMLSQALVLVDPPGRWRDASRRERRQKQHVPQERLIGVRGRRTMYSDSSRTTSRPSMSPEGNLPCPSASRNREQCGTVSSVGTCVGQSFSRDNYMSESPSPRTWPADWGARRAGEGCPMCAEGPGEVNGLGDLRIFASAVCEAYLRRTEIVPGYVVAVWRGRHVAELTELTDMEAAEFDRSVRAAARALERHYRPARLNFLTLGNAVPHLHVHIVPRYLTDPDPGKPPRFMMVDPPPGDEASIPDDVYLADVAALRRLVEDFVPTPGELLNVGRVALGAAAAIFDNQDRVLLVRHGYGRRNWELPGGAAEIGESPEQTAVREVGEETGLTVIPERITGIYLEPGHRLGPAMHFVLRCRREPPDAQPRIASDEIIDVAWVDLADLPRPISDFTVRRITDGTTSGPLLPNVIGERVWLEDAGNEH